MTDARGVRVEGFDPGDLATVFGQWDKVKFLADRLEQVEREIDPYALTARRFDEAKPAGHRGYSIASAYISAALEHIDTIRHLFARYGATPRVPWTLLRSVYEAGFWCSWLLEPDDSTTRIMRGLRAEVNAARERTNFYNTWFAHDPEQLAEATREHPSHHRKYQAEAAAHGLTWAQASNRIRVTQELETLRCVRDFEPALRDALIATWRSLSGIQHGHACAFVMNSDIHDQQQGDGHVRGTFTIKESAFVASAGAANILLVDGISLMIRRTTTR